MARRPVRSMEALTIGAIQTDPARAKADLKRIKPGRGYALGVAKVINIDYEEMYVTLRVEIGDGDDFVRVPVPLTWPGAGARHFMGAMPMTGDHCIIGWMPQESGRDKTKTPVILAWVVPGVWPGREWTTTAGFPLEELDTGIGPEAEMVRGTFDRIRHKLRHLHPGNIVASSGQGADLVLDEGVTLANRRGNEIRLRDQDQAFIVRSLQQFHAGAGFRVYSGMVQRDAQLLATTMVSDGQEWDSNYQSAAGEPVREDQLPSDTANPAGALSPARVLARSRQEDGSLGRPVLDIDPFLDPYDFLKRGGFINDAGFVLNHNWEADASYGGKNILRVASQGTSNAALDPDLPTLTEWRLEVNHTADGRLPVTEQTDLFDADRLPDTSPDAAGNNGIPSNMPFIEFVMGSVVGNDPYSQTGRGKYGVPIIPRIFDGDEMNPRLEAAKLVDVESSVEAPDPMGKHAASLFRLSPPINEAPDTFWAVNKDGQLMAHLGGPKAEFSVEAALRGGLKLGIGGAFQLLMNGGLHLGTNSTKSVRLESSKGPVVIFGGGAEGGSEALGERLGETDGGEQNMPSVDIQAGTNARIQAKKRVLVKADSAEVNATKSVVFGHEQVQVATGNRLDMSCKVQSLTVNGKSQESFGGPKDQDRTTGALHERTYSPNQPGLTCEEVLFSLGHQKKQFRNGNHEIDILIGDMLHSMEAGKYRVEAAGSSLTVELDGIDGRAPAGNVSLEAGAQANITGSASASLRATGGPATVKSSSSVILSAPLYGPDSGPILCAGSLEPFTNLPYATWGMGARAHLIG